MSTRSFQRRYRRAWLERHCSSTYRQIIAALTRCGRSLRTTSDREVVRLVVERLRLEDAIRRSTADAIVQLARDTGRSRRWVVAALRRLGVSPLDRPREVLCALRDEVSERARRARMRRRTAARDTSETAVSAAVDTAV